MALFRKKRAKNATKETVLLWYKDYSNSNLTVKSVADKYGVHPDTMIKRFHQYGFAVRSKGFQINNAQGKVSNKWDVLPYLHMKKFQYQRRALRKGLEFTLTDEEFLLLVKQSCYYCNKAYTEEIRKVNRRQIHMLTIDRVDSNKGYTKDNCVACCKQCNTMKMDIPLQDWYNKIELILNVKINRESNE